MDKMNATDLMFINTLSGNILGSTFQALSDINCSSHSNHVKDEMLHNLLEYFIHLSQNCYNIAKKSGLEYKNYDNEMRSLKSAMQRKRSRTMKLLKGGTVSTIVKHVKGKAITLFDPSFAKKELGADAGLIAERAIAEAEKGHVGKAVRLYSSLVEFQGLLAREKKEGPIGLIRPVILSGLAGGLSTIPAIIIYINCKVIVPLGIAAATGQIAANAAANAASGGLSMATGGRFGGRIVNQTTAVEAAAYATGSLNSIGLSLISTIFAASLMFCVAVVCMMVSSMLITYINMNSAPTRLKLNNNLRTRRREIANRAATFMNEDDVQRKTNLALFGLPETASNDDIRREHRKKARELHPDKRRGEANQDKVRKNFNNMQAAYGRLNPAGAPGPATPPASPVAAPAAGPDAGVGVGSP
jgi:hypothetical protein